MTDEEFHEPEASDSEPFELHGRDGLARGPGRSKAPLDFVYDPPAHAVIAQYGVAKPDDQGFPTEAARVRMNHPGLDQQFWARTSRISPSELRMAT